MNYLSPAQLLFIYDRLVAETGGTPGVRDVGLLASAAARPQATFDGLDIYPTLFLKAAALMDSLINKHPFVDGNKRVGITAAGLFLQLNGWRLSVSNVELERFTLRVAQGLSSIEEVAAWLEAANTRGDSPCILSQI